MTNNGKIFHERTTPGARDVTVAAAIEALQTALGESTFTEPPEFFASSPFGGETFIIHASNDFLDTAYATFTVVE